jgi:outer membrane protein TolC
MKMIALILVAALTAASSTQDKPSNQIEESAKKIKDLQKERIAVLKELVDHLDTRYKSGTASFEEVLEARILLFKAELETAEKGSDRISLYTKMIDTLNQAEQVAKAQFGVGKVTTGDVLKIKARRLEVEILLEQEKMKEAKEKK